MKYEALFLLILLQALSSFQENKVKLHSDVCASSKVQFEPFTGSESECGYDSTRCFRTKLQDFIQHISPLPVRSCVNNDDIQRECVSSFPSSALPEHIKEQQLFLESSELLSLRSVDYLFLIETNCAIIADQVIRTIQSLLEHAVDKQTFHNVIVQVGLIIYSNEEKPEYIFARDFSSEFPSDIYSFLLLKMVPLDCKNSLSYRSIDAGLKVTTTMLDLSSKEKQFHQNIRLSSNKSVSIWHRPYSDLHIVTILYATKNHITYHLGDDYVSSHGSNEDVLKIDMEDKIKRMSEKLASLSDQPISLHLFFNASNSAAVSLLGDPSLAVRYSDCSHFKKAATLKALILTGLGGTLQALVLSKGTEFQVHSLEELSDVTCIMNLSPSLSTTSGILPSFPDKCLLGSNKEYNDWYCSSLHGWTQKRKKNNMRESSEHSDYEAVVPLSGEYGTSHADLAILAVAVQEAEGSVELSINKKLIGKRDGQRPKIVGEPCAVEWRHDKPFIDEMLTGGKPVVLRKTVVQTWRALQKWNMTYVLQNMDTKVLQSVKCTNNYLTFDPDYRSPLKLNISLPYLLANMSTSDFLNCVEKSKACSDGFLGHYYFGTVPESLKKDIQPDRLLYHTDEDFKAAKQFMWISSSGMITHTHFDQDYNFFVQLVGEKRFTLWTPEQLELMYVYPRIHPLWHKSRVNFLEVDIKKFPGFSRAKGIQVKLGPGDMLYVPPYTWHYVETLSPSVSLSTWSHDYSLYDHMNSIYRHDHNFDLLQNKKGKVDGGSKKI